MSHQSAPQQPAKALSHTKTAKLSSVAIEAARVIAEHLDLTQQEAERVLADLMKEAS